MQTYKLLLIGDKETGKSAYIRRFLTGQFEDKYIPTGKFKYKYIPTLGVEVHPLVFNTNHGNYRFNAWDTAGDEQFTGLADGYYIKGDACIAFYTKNSNHDKTDKQVKRFMEFNPNAFLVIVWNKYDLPEEKEYFENMGSTVNGFNYIKRNCDANVYQISAKSNYNYEKPFSYLLGKLTDNNNLSII